MAGDDYPASIHVEAAVALVRGWVSEENTRGGARSEFVGGGGGEVWIAKAPEDTEGGVIWESAIENLMRYLVVDGGGGTPIEEGGGCGESLSPVRRRHEGMEEHGADGVVDSAEYAFGLAILRGRIGVGEA